MLLAQIDFEDNPVDPKPNRLSSGAAVDVVDQTGHLSLNHGPKVPAIPVKTEQRKEMTHTLPPSLPEWKVLLGRCSSVISASRCRNSV